MPNDELAFKLGESIRNKFVVDEDAFEKEEKSFVGSENRLNLPSEIASSSSGGRQQSRKSKKPTKALNIQLDSLASGKLPKAGRSQLTDCISQQFSYNSPHSSSSSPSNSPTSSPTQFKDPFTNNSLNNLASLTNPVNSSPLNSTNRATNSDHLNASQSILPINFIQKNQVLQGSTGKRICLENHSNESKIRFSHWSSSLQHPPCRRSIKI